MNIKTIIRQYTILLMVFLLSSPVLFAQAGFNDDRIMLQGFYWDCYRFGHTDRYPMVTTNTQNIEKFWYQILNEKVTDIKEAGFDLIWLPPPSKGSGMAGYGPTEYFSFDNMYGDDGLQTNLLVNLLNNGIEPIADIVINHRNGSVGWAGFRNPQWGTTTICSSDEAFYMDGSDVQNLDMSQRGDEEERPVPYCPEPTTYQYPVYRDLDHTKEIVRRDIVSYLARLKEMGYRGWRYDMVHGYHANKVAYYNQISQPTFSVGEYAWDKHDEARGWVWLSAANENQLTTASSVFDFTTWRTLKENKGNYDALYSYGLGIGLVGDNTDGQAWKNRAVTFLENHDTGWRCMEREENGRVVLDQEGTDSFSNGWEVEQGYAYILTHPGVPCVYWKHYFDWGDDLTQKLKGLINARKVTGVHAGSELNTQNNARSNGVYAARIVGSKGIIYMRLGGDDNAWQPYYSGYSDYLEYVAGNGWKVWVHLFDERLNHMVQQASANQSLPLP
ncbi:alpha-amylase [Marinilabiliaceae bacterium JC017]|nr:alpha-amylase [Marinilabiliaceae bacterium JC017]